MAAAANLRSAADGAVAADWRTKLLLLLAVAAVYGSYYWPSTPIRHFVRDHLGNPKGGFLGTTFPHIFLYTTFASLFAVLLWWAFHRARVLPSVEMKVSSAVLRYGAAAGLAAIVILGGVAVLEGGPGVIRWIGSNPWSVAGNLFSNFYEEFIYRGFALAAFTVVFGLWPAIVLSSLLWGFTHTQYPLTTRAAISVVGMIFCWAGLRARSLLAPYGAHMLMDVVLDAILA